MRRMTTPAPQPPRHGSLRTQAWAACARLQGSALLRPSLFKRLLGVQLLVFTALLAVLLSLTIMLLLARGNGGLDTDLKLLAQALARTSSLNPTPDGIAAAAEHITALHLETADTPISPDELGWQVWHKDGRLLTRSPNGDSLPDFPPGSLSTSERSEHPGWILLAAWDPAQQLYAVFAQSSQVTTRLLDRTLKGMLPTTLVIVATVFAALWLAMRLGLQPLAQLAHQLSQRDPQETTELANAPPHVELAPMVHALNALLARVRSLRAAEHGFFADAAHELRTPLAAINAQAHALTMASSAAQRAANVLDKLLTLARLDHTVTLGPQATALHRTDLAALLRDTLAMQASRTALSQHTLDLDAPTELWAPADAPALAAALDNLVDNALRYTPPGSQVRVRLVAEPPQALIAVEDSGPGIAAQDRVRVFQRFERGPHSDGISGCGLGLAIVERVAAAHHGSVTLDASPALGGARFCIRIPLNHHGHPAG
jgi:signal transduction histidine kinase